MLFLPIHRSLLLLLPVIQNSLHPRCLFFLNVLLLLVFQVLVPHLLVGVVESVSLLFYRVVSGFQLYIYFGIFFCSVVFE